MPKTKSRVYVSEGQPRIGKLKRQTELFLQAVRAAIKAKKLKPPRKK